MTRIYQSSWGRTNPRHGFHERTENGGAVHGCTRRHQEVGARMGRAHDSDDTDSREQDGALVVPQGRRKPNNCTARQYDVAENAPPVPLLYLTAQAHSNSDMQDAGAVSAAFGVQGDTQSTHYHFDDRGLVFNEQVVCVPVPRVSTPYLLPIRSLFLCHFPLHIVTGVWPLAFVCACACEPALGSSRGAKWSTSMAGRRSPCRPSRQAAP